MLIQQRTAFGLGGYPFRYLGVPMMSSRLKACHYAPLVNKISDLTRSWRGKTLSYAGRLELVRAVVQGTTNFWMGCFPMPSAVLKQVASLCRNFLWAKAEGSSSKPLVAWKMVCLPKNLGGLGLFSLAEWNMALLAKSLWELHSDNQALWIKWIHSYYLRGQNIWEYRATH